MSSSLKPLNRRDFLKSASLGLLGTALLSGAACRPRTSAKPNFIFFLTDDQRWDGMSCAGNPILKTPNMDRIAAGGVRFPNMFVTTALCGPSRASFLTGLYSHNHGIRRNPMSLALRHRTFPEMLKDAGYETAFIGKWHNTDLGRGRGFDYHFGFEDQGQYFNPLISENEGPFLRYEGHITDILTDKALEFLERPHDRPFCLLLWFKAPHSSFHPAERFKNLYQDVTVPKPDNFDDSYETRPDAVKNVNFKIGDFEDVPDFQTFVKDYYRCLAGVDENLGRVLDACDRLGYSENTTMLYAGDNGFFIGEHHFFDKRFMYEESIRVPLLIRTPGSATPGTTREEMALNVDVAPTILEMAGLPVPPDMNGRSLKPILEGRSVEWRQDFLYEYYEFPGAHSGRKCRGVRTDRWKYIHFFEEPQEFELYDLESDPHEMTNLADRPEFRSIRDKLRIRLEKLRLESGDPDV